MNLRDLLLLGGNVSPRRTHELFRFLNMQCVCVCVCMCVISKQETRIKILGERGKRKESEGGTQ